MGILGKIFTAHCLISGYSVFYALAENSKTVVLPSAKAAAVAATSSQTATSHQKAAVRQVLRMYKGSADYSLLQKQYAEEGFTYDDPLLSFHDRDSFSKAAKLLKKLRPVELSHDLEYVGDQVVIRKVHQLTIPLLKRQVMHSSTTVLDFNKDGKIIKQNDYWYGNDHFKLQGVDITQPSRALNGLFAKLFS